MFRNLTLLPFSPACVPARGLIHFRLLSRCSAAAQSKPPKQIYVGVSSVSMGNIMIYITKEAKLFE